MIEIFMNGKLSLFFFLKSISEKISNLMELLLFPSTLLEKCQNFTKKFCWTGVNCYLTILLYHRPYYLNINGLINKSKSEKIVHIFLIFQMMVSISSVTWLIRWLQLVHVMPKLLVEALNKDLGLSFILAIYDQDLIKNCKFYTRDKLVSKELYNI